MRYTIQMDRDAVADMYAVDRPVVQSVWAVLDRLSTDIGSVTYQSYVDDPSLYWVAVDGDYSVFFEILDESATILVVAII